MCLKRHCFSSIFDHSSNIDFHNLAKNEEMSWKDVIYFLAYLVLLRIVKYSRYVLTLKMFRNTTLFFKHKKSFYRKFFDWRHFTDFIFLLEVWYIPIGGLWLVFSYFFVFIIYEYSYSSKLFTNLVFRFKDEPYSSA